MPSLFLKVLPKNSCLYISFQNQKILTTKTVYCEVMLTLNSAQDTFPSMTRVRPQSQRSQRTHIPEFGVWLCNCGKSGVLEQAHIFTNNHTCSKVTKSEA